MNYSTNAVPQTQTIRVGGIIQNASRPLKRERNLLPSSWLPVSLTLATASLLLYLRKTTGSASSQVRSCACVTLSTYSSLFLSNDRGCGQGQKRKKEFTTKKKNASQQTEKKTLSREQLLAVLIKECKASNLLDNEKNPPKKKTKAKKKSASGLTQQFRRPRASATPAAAAAASAKSVSSPPGDSFTNPSRFIVTVRVMYSTPYIPHHILHTIHSTSYILHTIYAPDHVVHPKPNFVLGVRLQHGRIVEQIGANNP